MKLGQQVDDLLGVRSGYASARDRTERGQEVFLKARLTLRDRFYSASHLRKAARDGVTIIGAGHRDQCADGCRQTGNEPTRRLLEFVRFYVMREDRKCANNLVG